MKATLEFNLPEEREEFGVAVQAMSLKLAIDDIQQRVFRPARKHGYPETHIAQLVDSLPDGKGEQLIGMLEQLYLDILVEYGVGDL